jgi:hypothetical protein
MSAIGSLSALPSHTGEPSGSTTQIEVVFSETSSPTNKAILRLPCWAESVPDQGSEGRDRITPARAKLSGDPVVVLRHFQ